MNLGLRRELQILAKASNGVTLSIFQPKRVTRRALSRLALTGLVSVSRVGASVHVVANAGASGWFWGNVNSPEGEGLIEIRMGGTPSNG